MDVLNTTGGGVDTLNIICGIIFGGIAIIGGYGVIDTMRDRYYGVTVVCFLAAAWFALLAIASFVYVEPTRHEVTLRPGHVIDAEKYEIVEHRGKIYVIEEREAEE